MTSTDRTGDISTLNDATDTPRTLADDRHDAHVGVYGGTVSRERYATYLAWEAECTLMKVHSFGTPEHCAARDRAIALWACLMTFAR